jgi:hypothetical protein
VARQAASENPPATTTPVRYGRLLSDQPDLHLASSSIGVYPVGMRRRHSVTLVLFGMVLGCGAAAVSPIARGWAQQVPGRWDCFVVDQFPDVDAARSWSGAANITAGLNRVATHVAAGTVLSVAPKGGSYPSVACVKY